METGIFDNVHKGDPLNFRDGASYHFAKIANFLELENSDLSKMSGVSKASIRFDKKIPKELQERLIEIANICGLVADFFKGDPLKTALWFKIANPMLGNMAPRDMIRLGRYKKLLQLIMDSKQEFPTSMSQ